VDADPRHDPRHERGRELFEQVNGFAAPDSDHPLIEMTVDHVFGEVWARPGLTRKERRWIAITGVAAAGAETALEVHVGAALGSGDITIDELREAVAHFAVYQGYPRATVLHAVVERVWATLADERRPDPER
jgi:4-carboxymuconolactone decarboxylase